VEGGDSDGEDGLQSMYTAENSAPLGKEQFLHSVMNESVTNYLNALLNAKNTNQIVIMSDDPGESESLFLSKHIVQCIVDTEPLLRRAWYAWYR
jgi:hypothetical protein